MTLLREIELFCRDHNITPTAFGRVTIRTKTGWVGEYVVRECRICHAIRSGGRSSNPTPKSKWSRYLADHTRRT